MSAEEYAVVARGVDHWFGEGELRKQVLFENDLRISPGEIVIMTGPSGSGKTTLLTLIGALRKLQNGSLQVRGTELAGLGDDGLMRVRRRIGFIFQAHNLFASLTATENVRLALELEPGTVAERNSRAKAMLTQLGLEDRLEHKPNQLSGGQRQRVAIARALVGRPGLILADEPTAALDEQSGRTVVGLLRNFADQERAAILIVTHDNRILDVADRIVNMTFGRIVSNVKKQETLQICEFLSQVSVFQNLTPTALAAVADNMTLESFAAGTPLIRQGDDGDKFYVIRSGTAEVLVDSARVRTLQAGDSFGEIALISDQPRTATVRALEPFEAYTLGKADFRSAIEKSETFREQVLKVYFQRQ